MGQDCIDQVCQVVNIFGQTEPLFSSSNIILKEPRVFRYNGYKFIYHGETQQVVVTDDKNELLLKGMVDAAENGLHFFLPGLWQLYLITHQYEVEALATKEPAIIADGEDIDASELKVELNGISYDITSAFLLGYIDTLH